MLAVRSTGSFRHVDKSERNPTSRCRTASFSNRTGCFTTDLNCCVLCGSYFLGLVNEQRAKCSGLIETNHGGAISTTFDWWTTLKGQKSACRAGSTSSERGCPARVHLKPCRERCGLLTSKVAAFVAAEMLRKHVVRQLFATLVTQETRVCHPRKPENGPRHQLLFRPM